MNSAANYASATQRHADAIREARRDPPPRMSPVSDSGERGARDGLLVRLARRTPLRTVLGL
jgi:hypothetical protein